MASVLLKIISLTFSWQLLTGISTVLFILQSRSFVHLFVRTQYVICLIFKGNCEYIFNDILYIVSHCQLILPSLYVDLGLCSCNIMRKIIEISKHCVWRVYSLQFSISTSSAL